MSTNRGSGGAGNGGGVQLIPAGARKVVQSLKEIVSCPDTEIYAALKDSNMDPNEAVNHLLSQDPFHEVKSKREKKKEGRENHDHRTHGVNNSSTRHGKNGADRHLGRGASASYNASESPIRGKSIYRKENGSDPHKSNFSSAVGVSGNNRSEEPSGFSSAETKGSLLGTADGMPSVHTTSGYQSTWVGVPGQLSMADIVRMRRRPHSKPSHAPSASYHNLQDTWAAEPFPTLRSADHASKVNQSEVSSFQHVHSTDEWPAENPAPTDEVYIPEYTVAAAELHLEESGAFNGSNHRYEEEDIQDRDDDNVGNAGRNDLGSVAIPSRKFSEDDSRGSPLYENELYQNLASYQSEAPDYVHHEGEEVNVLVSSISRNLEQLTVEKDDTRLPSEGNIPSVVIPDHLQVQAADCSHLSFGSFGSGMAASNCSGTLSSVPVKSNLEGHNRANIPSAGHVDASQPEYYIDDSLRNTPDRFHRNGPDGATAEIYDASSTPQPEELKPETNEVAHGHQYPFPPPNPGYALDDAQGPNTAFNETSSQMQNLAQLSSVMSYTNSLPSTLLTGNVYSARESDHQYSPFPVSHSMSTKYGNSVSSVGSSAISLSEALKTANSSTQPAPQSISGTSVATGPPLPQHIAVHPYSQPALPLGGPFANMIGYPLLHQSYQYMPSAFQHSLAGNNTHHQSLAALLPQYKSSVSVSSLPHSASIPSGYGGLGSANSVLGNYPLNPPAAPSGSVLNYEDVLSSQYKESSHLLSLQQNESPAMWLQGQGSRTVQAVPSSAYYNHQGQQNQQPSGFRQQGQQQSQNYGAPGYLNFYHTQTGISLDQQQNPRDGTLGASQGQPKPSQIWLNGY